MEEKVITRRFEPSDWYDFCGLLNKLFFIGTSGEHGNLDDFYQLCMVNEGPVAIEFSRYAAGRDDIRLTVWYGETNKICMDKQSFMGAKVSTTGRFIHIQRPGTKTIELELVMRAEPRHLTAKLEKLFTNE